MRFAKSLGIENIRRRWARPGGIQGEWNGMNAGFSLEAFPFSRQKGGFTSISADLQVGLPKERFYLRNKALPPLYTLEVRSIRYLKLPSLIHLPLKEDDRLFEANATSIHPLRNLLASPNSRRLIFDNLIEADGELVLQGGRLTVYRQSRMNLRARKQATLELTEKILAGMWNLLKTSTAILQPLKLNVTDRLALALYCPYCKNELQDSVGLIRCTQCHTLHHANCWKENGKCSVFGCSGIPALFIKDSSPR